MNFLNRYFELESRGTTVGREFRGAVATFLTMAYILAANPAILGAAGVPVDSAVACTALAAGICTIAMGLIANFPLALASGMGLTALVAYTAAAATGSWQTAMGIVVLDGLIISVLVVIGLREAMLDAIPLDLRRGMAAGIGLFIALIGCVNSGLVSSSGMPVPPLRPGDFVEPSVLITLAGIVVIAALHSRKVPGAILIGIVACAVASHVSASLEPVAVGDADAHVGQPSDHERVSALPSFRIIGQADVVGAMSLQFLPLLLTLLMVDFFDTLGTVTALGDQTGLKDANARVPGLRRILLVDSVSAAIGGWFGVSSVTSYIESAAGISEGARTGLHSVFVGLFFLLCVFASPLVALIPPEATAPALIVVGCLMAASITRIDFTQAATAVPAFVTLLLIPTSYSISHGIGYGILTYVAIQLLTLQWRNVHPLLYGAAAVFAIAFAWAG